MLAAVRKVRLIDINDEKTCFGFNPLEANTERDARLATDFTTNIIARVVGGEKELEDTPQIKTNLKKLCYLLSINNLTLMESEYVFYEKHRATLKRLVSNIENAVSRRLWDYELEKDYKTFKEDWEAILRRLPLFIEDQIVQGIFGQKKKVIDFQKCMDNGEIILVNLQEKMATPEVSRTIGRLFIATALRMAKRREGTVQPRPWYFYFDECNKYLTNDIADILREARKYGLHLILAHQDLSPLREAGQDVFAAVMSIARTKVIFGDLDREDAELMAKRVFVGIVRHDLINHIFDKPTAIGWKIIQLTNESESKGKTKSKTSGNSIADGTTEGTATARTKGSSVAEGEMYGTNKGRSDSAISASGETLMYLADGPTIGDPTSQNISSSEANVSGNVYGSNEAISFIHSDNTGEAFTESFVTSVSTTKSETRGKTTTKTKGKGKTEAIAPDYRTLSTAKISMEEQWHILTEKLMLLQERHALVAIPKDRYVAQIRTLDTPDLPDLGSITKNLISNLTAISPFQTPFIEIMQEIEKRQFEIENVEEELFDGFAIKKNR